MNEIIQAAAIVAIQVLLPVVLGLVAFWIKKGIDKIKSEMDQSELEFAMELARELVLAAEQSGLIGALENVGEAKKQWVMAELDAALQKRGIKLDLALLSSLIEAAVHEAFKM